MATSAKAEAATKADAADAAVNSGVKGPGERFLTERTPAKAELPRTKTAVLVLNGSGTRGAAREAAARLESERYRVIDTNDAAHPDYRRTLVLYRKGIPWRGRTTRARPWTRLEARCPRRRDEAPRARAGARRTDSRRLSSAACSTSANVPRPTTPRGSAPSIAAGSSRNRFRASAATPFAI